MNVIENIIIGIISGLVSSWMITQAYRQYDKQQYRYEYINELYVLADTFEKMLFYPGAVNVDDEYVLKLKDFVTSNFVPKKKKWVKLQKDEVKCCEDFIDFYNKMTQEIFKCHLDIQRKPDERAKYISEIENAKVKFITISHMEAMMHKSKIFELKKDYTN